MLITLVVWPDNIIAITGDDEDVTPEQIYEK
jgi:hypothetical protein